tara:strand:- start:342 stop:761 length:420 start_codon:yes stop_codon:yes gene_type:complete
MISFKKINKNNQDDIKKLFFLIKSRKYNISNTQNPNFEDHKKFVLNNPYREWLFIIQKDILIGSAYITFENFIGINLIDANKNTYIIIIKLLLSEFKPLPEIKSIRNKNFLFNLSPKNKKYIEALEDLKMIHIQNTYTS